MRKQLAIIGLSAGLVGGGAAGLALTGTAGAAGAQDQTTTTVAPNSTTAPDATQSDPTQTDTAKPDTPRPDRSARLQETLAPLVTAGTITQAQADAVIAALEAAGPPDGGHGHGHGGGPGSEAAATALGLTTDELRTELESGKTIAAIATEQGVALTTVTDAMLAAEKEHLAAEVTAGKLTQAEADQRLADAPARITARVNGTAPEGGHRGGPDGGPPPSDNGSTSPGSTDSTTTTES